MAIKSIQDEVVTHCFRCGEQDIPLEEVVEENRCPSCGEYKCLVTVNQALDIINDLYLDGKFEYIEDNYN